MKYVVYILQSLKTNRYYVGFTSDVFARLVRHNQGRNNATRRDRPWKVIYREIFTNRNDAYQRERQIKSYKGGKAFKKLINRGVA